MLLSDIIFAIFLLFIGYLIVWHCVLPQKAKKFLRECLPCLRSNKIKKERKHKKAPQNKASIID